MADISFSDEWLEQLKIEAANKLSDEQKLKILLLIGFLNLNTVAKI